MESDGLGEVKKSLYRRATPPQETHRETFRVQETRARPEESNVPPKAFTWTARLKGSAEERSPSPGPSLAAPRSPVKTIIVFGAVLILLGLAVAAFFVFFGGGTVSARNIDIETTYSSFTEGGKVNDIAIAVINRNSVPLELADLILEFPEGSFAPSGEKLSRERFALGLIHPGEKAEKAVAVAFYGREDEEKETKITLEYRLAESNAIFAKEAIVAMRLSRSPMGVALALPAEVNSGDRVEAKVDLVSNAESDIQDIILRLEYPPGFQFLSASPNPSEGKYLWKIGTLSPGEKRTVVVTGLIQGQDLEEKGFRAEAGALSGSGVFQTYGLSAESLEIKKPFLALRTLVNGIESDKAFASLGSTVTVTVRWANNLTTPVIHAVLEARLEGQGYDEGSIVVSRGVYRASTKTIVWNASSDGVLASLDPGASGEESFSFRVPPTLAAASGPITVAVTMRGENTSEESAGQTIESEKRQEILTASRLELSARAVYTTGPFVNAGPLPPRVGEETTYTVIWSLGNNVNDFVNVVVASSLPAYVRWVGNVSPSGEKVIYEEATGEVRWEVGAVPAGTGVDRPARDVAFQIGFSPGLNQIGSSPVLVQEMNLKGHDLAIDRAVLTSRGALSTRLDQDPRFLSGQDKVGE